MPNDRDGAAMIDEVDDLVAVCHDKVEQLAAALAGVELRAQFLRLVRSRGSDDAEGVRKSLFGRVRRGRRYRSDLQHHEHRVDVAGPRLVWVPVGAAHDDAYQLALAAEERRAGIALCGEPHIGARAVAVPPRCFYLDKPLCRHPGPRIENARHPQGGYLPDGQARLAPDFIDDVVVPLVEIGEL